MTTGEVVRWQADLMRPEAFPHDCDEVTHLETHISHLYFVGDRVYKLKKPVKTDFLDYSTLARRRWSCEEEVRLNRRLTSGVYLRVAPLGLDEVGRWGVDVGGEALEWAVEMRRLPAEGMLEWQLEHGDVDPETFRRFAERLARFHAEAATGGDVDAWGAPPQVRRVMLDNLSSCRMDLEAALVGETALCAELSAIVQRLTSFWSRRIDETSALLAARVAEGRVREGHGDLHAGNICLEDDRFQVYDGIEFDARFRCMDVAAEVAFLAMDLRHRGAEEAATEFVAAYAEAADDPGVHDLVPFFRVHWSLVRSRVTFLRARSMPRGDEREKAIDDAVRYLLHACGEVAERSLIAMCGLPGGGKSWWARRLAHDIGFPVLVSDVLRKERLGLAPETRPDAALRARLYSPEAKAATYRALLEEGTARLQQGSSVILDATLTDPRQRAEAAAIARQEGVRSFLIHATADEATTLERLRRRGDDPQEPSDAGEEVYRALKARFVAPITNDDWTVIKASHDADPRLWVAQFAARLLGDTE